MRDKRGKKVGKKAKPANAYKKQIMLEGEFHTVGDTDYFRRLVPPTHQRPHVRYQIVRDPVQSNPR